jgi:hypothetical protein
MTFITPTLKFEVKPTTNGGYTVEIVAAPPAYPHGCFGRTPGAKPGAKQTFSLDRE